MGNKQVHKKIEGTNWADETLLEFYKMGWEDCADGNKERQFEEQQLQRAYNIGWCDFIVGDDVKRVDMQTEKEILKHIKNYKLKQL